MKIGGVMILASILLFSASVYMIDSNTAAQNNVSISAGSTFTLHKGLVSAGDDIDFTVTSNLNGFNITAYVLFDHGVTAGSTSSTNSTSISNVIVSPVSGNASLVIVNHGAGTINVDASIGNVNYLTLITTVFGFVLLPSGIALVGIFFYSRRVERAKEKILRGFE